MERHWHAMNWEEYQEVCALSVTSRNELRCELSRRHWGLVAQRLEAWHRLEPELPSKDAVLPPFTPPTGGAWGFGRAAKRSIAPRGSVAWRFPLPRGIGADYADCDPTYCTIGELFRALLSVLDPQPVELRPQLLLLTGYHYRPGYPHGAAFTAVMGPRMYRWVLAVPAETFEPVRRCMARTLARVWPDYPRPHDRAVGVIRSEENFGLLCPENACDITGEGMHAGDDPGLELGSHNLDQSMQAVILLWGLAKLYQLARKAGA